MLTSDRGQPDGLAGRPAEGPRLPGCLRDDLADQLFYEALDLVPDGANRRGALARRIGCYRI